MNLLAIYLIFLVIFTATAYAVLRSFFRYHIIGDRIPLINRVFLILTVVDLILTLSLLNYSALSL